MHAVARTAAVGRSTVLIWTLIGLIGLLGGAACNVAREAQGPGPDMDTIAESYVKLVLAMGHHDDDYVDAYYGPEHWKAEVDAARPSLADIADRAAELIRQLDAAPAAARDELVGLRHRYLRRQLESLAARVRMLSGERLSFDEESQALYDAVAPVHAEEQFSAILARLEQRIPGRGPLHERFEAYRRQFVIPADRLDSVFRAAIEACRERTTARMALPEKERFTVEYVTGKAWSGYNWYQGDYGSLIQVNTDLPIHIDRAIDLACHEGYPGHHVYSVLLEQRLVRERGWVEYSVYALFSPQSLIAEGTANFGIEVAFPGRERVEFERTVLFPLAGLDPAKAEEYYELQELLEELSYAGNEAARRYLNGDIDRAEAAAWLQRFAMMSRARAEQRVRFFDQYRSYVINYNLGKDLVRQYIEARGGTADRPDVRWREFERLLSSPRLPSDLRIAAPW